MAESPTMDVSCWTFIRMAQLAEPFMHKGGQGPSSQEPNRANDTDVMACLLASGLAFASETAKSLLQMKY